MNSIQFEISRLKNLIVAYGERQDIDTAEYHARNLFDIITAKKLKEKTATIVKINTFCHNAIGITMATSILTMLMAVTNVRPLTNTIAFFASTMVAGMLLAGTVLALNHLAVYIRQTFEEYDEKARIFIKETLSQTIPHRAAR